MNEPNSVGFDVNEQTLQPSRVMCKSCRETCKHRWTINNNYFVDCIRIKHLVSY